MIHTATPPASPKLHRTSLYIKISERYQRFFGKQFLLESIVDQDEYKRFLKIHQNGELFGLTVFNPIGKEDHIIAGVQFKRSKQGVWINYIGTSGLEITGPMFGVSKDFLPPGNFFTGLGIGLMLLRSVQLYQCAHGMHPNLFIQVKCASLLADYLQRRGFKSVVFAASIVDPPEGEISMEQQKFQDFMNQDDLTDLVTESVLI